MTLIAHVDGVPIEKLVYLLAARPPPSSPDATDPSGQGCSTRAGTEAAFNAAETSGAVLILPNPAPEPVVELVAPEEGFGGTVALTDLA